MLSNLSNEEVSKKKVIIPKMDENIEIEKKAVFLREKIKMNTMYEDQNILEKEAQQHSAI